MNDTMIVSLRLASGDFLSELRMPIPVTDEERKHAVERWLDFMATGFRLSAERMDAVFDPSLRDAVASEEPSSSEAVKINTQEEGSP